MESSFNLFRTFIRDMEMREVAYRRRRRLTWTSNRQVEGFIEERLDMVFGSADWHVDFDKTEVQYILNQPSDHSMLVLVTNPQQPKVKSRFIFDNRWSRMQRCTKVIQNNWKVEVEGSKMFKFHNKVKHYREQLLEWRKKKNTNSGIHIEGIKRLDRNNKGGGWDTWYDLRTQLENHTTLRRSFGLGNQG